MPTVIYQSDRSQSQTQRAQTKLGNELTGKTATTIYEKGSQAQKSNEPMSKSPDIWATFPVTKKETL